MSKLELATLYKERQQIERELAEIDPKAFGYPGFAVRTRSGLKGRRTQIDLKIAKLRGEMLTRSTAGR